MGDTNARSSISICWAIKPGRNLELDDHCRGNPQIAERFKKSVDAAADKTKEVGEKVVDKTKDAAAAAGDKVKKAGLKLKDAGK